MGAGWQAIRTEQILKLIDTNAQLGLSHDARLIQKGTERIHHKQHGTLLILLFWFLHVYVVYVCLHVFGHTCVCVWRSEVNPR